MMIKQRNRDDERSSTSHLRAVHAPVLILMATDLSARSDRALERAVELARAHSARLIVYHVIDEDLPATVQDRVASAAKSEIEVCMEKMRGARQLDISIDVTAGKDYRDILDKAESAGADLIVMGIHRNEAGDKPIAGTTLERVIRNGQRPVLVAQARVKGDYRRAMVGVDFSVFSRVAIRTALATAPNAEFYMVHAFQVPFQGFQPGRETRRAVEKDHERELAHMIEEEMAHFVETSADGLNLKRAPKQIVRHGETRVVLRAEVDRLGPDLLALGTHGRVGLSHALLGSVAEDFLNGPPCDVLAVKAW